MTAFSEAESKGKEGGLHFGLKMKISENTDGRQDLITLKKQLSFDLIYQIKDLIKKKSCRKSKIFDGFSALLKNNNVL